MTAIHFSDAVICIEPARGCVTSLTVGSRNLLACASDLFRFCIRKPDSTTQICVSGAGTPSRSIRADNGLTLSYTGFPDTAQGVCVTLQLSAADGALICGVSVQNTTDAMIEWNEVLPLTLPPLRAEGGPLGGEILYPYNEGVLVDSMRMRQCSPFGSFEPQYPSHGAYPVFPNMICSQMTAYLYDGDDGRRALYFGAHDARCGVKAIDFREADCGGIEMVFRYYCGVDYGADYDAGFPFVIHSVNGGWEAAADIYRAWFETNLPERLTKIAENDRLPDWYADNPFVVSYPVRGIHDMDRPMRPNALYPYTHALPLIDEIAEKTDARLLVLLMHWEGTAP